MNKVVGYKTLAAFILMLVALAGNSHAQTVTTLASFMGPNGKGPVGSLVQGTNGNFFGATAFGGGHNSGAIFEVTPSGKLTEVYGFCLQSGCPDGSQPNGLIRATDGNFYGTTVAGGNAVVCPGYACGTVFKISASGKLTTLYKFCSQTNCTDGSRPTGNLVEGVNGSLYGTTSDGGSNDPDCFGSGCGTIFKITPQGKLITLYSFCSQANCADGWSPGAALIQGTNRNFYGTTQEGGAFGSFGTVFEITPSGKFTNLYSFCSQSDCPDGEIPEQTLVQAPDGNFYGTTFEGGGSKFSVGTVFEMTPAGDLTTLYSFCSLFSCADGEFPSSALVLATDGNFYGTTTEGQPAGTIFQMTAGGSLTTLYSDGNEPQGLLQSTNGIIYGLTHQGGTGDCLDVYHEIAGCGSVFSLSIGLAPFISPAPVAGKIGQGDGILGQGFTGTTNVSFNGTAASFSVVSDTFINATVPAGATTGFVTVNTPNGPLTSNVAFQVIP